MNNTKLQVLNDACEDEQSCSCCAVDFFEEKPPLWKRRQIITGSIAGALLVSGLIIKFTTGHYLVSQFLFASVIAVAGRDILRKAGRSILNRRLDMNCLMSIAAIGAFFIGHGEEGAAVIFLFFIAEFLEEHAADNAKKSIGDLMHLAPETANVKRDGRELNLHVHEIKKSEIVLIRPGEKIPLDGKVVTGHSSVNEAPITGESLPAHKTEGDDVYAGTLNEEGFLEIEVTRKSEETVLSRIVKLVEEAERKKSDTERYIDRFARIYTPTVIGLAFAVFLVPTLFLGLPWETWFYRSLVLLVVSCPCALSISTPVAMVSAITGAARQGVLIKGGTFIEELSKVRTVAFDKTGTLTKGKLEITDIISMNGHADTGVLSIAASLEANSVHPIAMAITREAAGRDIEIKKTDRFRSIQGMGLEGIIEGKQYFLGSKNFFNSLGQTLPEEFADLERQGKTAIYISEESTPVGIVALGDIMRSKAPEMINNLKKLNIRSEMLTGDNEEVARSMSVSLGLDTYYAGLLPEDKVRVVEELSRRHGHIAMVGDGVNDAPSLATADVGIAMGTIGSDVAIETADIALMHDDLSRIDYIIMLSRKTMNIVKQNVTASLIIKGSFTVMALLGWINLWVAVGIGDMGLSLAVIFNAMRLMRVRVQPLRSS
jgi:Cd2+/Zn2+-exporting ATPase